MNLCKTCGNWKVQLRDDHKPDHRRYGFCSLPDHVGVMAKHQCEDYKSIQIYPNQMRRAAQANEIARLKQFLAGKKNPD